GEYSHPRPERHRQERPRARAAPAKRATRRRVRDRELPEPFARIARERSLGHVKGSFTGAVADTMGKVAAADGGTLFLDEIGEMPLEIQPKLLRLLQEREYERVGEAKIRRANVRVIAATNRNLADDVKAGKFRED